MRSATDNTLFQKIISTSTVNKILCVSVLGVVIYGLKIFFGRDTSYIHDCEGVTKTIKELVCGLFKKSSKAEQKVIPTEIENIEKKKASETENKKAPEAKKQEEPKAPQIGEAEVPKIEDEKASEIKEEEKKEVPKIEKAEAPQELEAPKIEELEEEEAGVYEEAVSESKPNPSAMSPRKRLAEYQKNIEKINQELEQHTSRLNIESCHWENDTLNVILNSERPVTVDISVYRPTDRQNSPRIRIENGNPGHHLIYGLSVALKKPFFRLTVSTRGQSLIRGSAREVQIKLKRIYAETCCQGICRETESLKKTENRFFNHEDLKNLASICEFLFNVMNPAKNQYSLARDAWIEANNLLQKLEGYARETQDLDAYQLFLCFKFDIEQLQLLVPPTESTKSARKI